MRQWLAQLSPDVRQYMVVTGNYWAFTLTDGALRMLVVLYFHDLGYSPLDIALLFVFYELSGVVTNLLGGWLGAHLGLNRIMNFGLLLQVVALCMLLLPVDALGIAWVMSAQALSGIAKDLNKMSAKSAVRLLVPAEAPGRLYRWVALLTGSKNALKGAGFFLGGVLLSLFGFRGAILSMVLLLTLVWLSSLVSLRKDLGRARRKPRLTELFSKSKAINILSAARMFLFGSRDVWFVVALPVYLSSTLGWSHWTTGSFLALWIIGYGFIQALAPIITGAGAARTVMQRPEAVHDSESASSTAETDAVPGGRQAMVWGLGLMVMPALIAMSLTMSWYPQAVLLTGLLLFGALFAINSSLHSFLIVSYANEDGVSLDIGFYYMANAMGRLIGTLLSGWLFQQQGMIACLWVSTLLLALTVLISTGLPRR